MTTVTMVTIIMISLAVATSGIVLYTVPLQNQDTFHLMGYYTKVELVYNITVQRLSC